jgi:HAD superfamily hydrolase (TIGR01509 family)
LIRAVIFDFDGLILETEEPTYRSWQEVYRSFGHPLPFSTFASMVGTTHGEFDPRLELERLIEGKVDWEIVESRRQESEIRLVKAQPILPGVEQYLGEARRLGLKIGLASTSSRRWVVGNLTRIGLVNYFDCTCTADDVQHIKPDPEPYLCTLRRLEVRANEAFALEDSPPGILSAKRAGLTCVAVPNVLTRRLDLSQADLRLESMADIPFTELLERVAAVKTQGAAS